MDTSKNETVWYGISTKVHSTLLLYHFLNVALNIHV